MLRICAIVIVATLAIATESASADPVKIHMGWCEHTGAQSMRAIVCRLVRG
jgi:hypothetical protein